jgi:glutamyl-tRNA reductase
LAAVDVVIGSVGADHHVLTRPLLDGVMRVRKYRPMFLVDMSVPRTFDPAANDIDNVYLYDIDDLGRVAAANRDERSREAQKAEAIVEEEVEAFWKWLVQLDAVPTIVALRAKLETIRKSELEKTLAALDGLSPHHRACLEAMTAAIVNKTLHAPITRLKRHNPREEAFYLAAARQLFDIEEPASAGMLPPNAGAR